MILTNSFGGTSFRLKLHQSESHVAELNSSAAQLARQAAEEADKPVIVAGSVGPTGELFSPLGALKIMKWQLQHLKNNVWLYKKAA